MAAETSRDDLEASTQAVIAACDGDARAAAGCQLLSRSGGRTPGKGGVARLCAWPRAETAATTFDRRPKALTHGFVGQIGEFPIVRDGLRRIVARTVRRQNKQSGSRRRLDLHNLL